MCTPAASVSQTVCMLISKKRLYYLYTCTCPGAQNTCSKVYATLITKKKHTYVYKHTYAHAYICA